MGQLAYFGRQRGKALGVFAFILAQNAQAAARHHFQRIGAALFDQIVLAIAKKGEMAVAQPAKKCQVFAAGAAGCHFLLCQLQAFDDARPVLYCGTDFRQHPRQIVGNRRQPLGIGLAVDFDVDQRFQMTARRTAVAQAVQFAVIAAADRQYRVNDQVRGHAVAVQRHADRIDQERHVLIHDFHDRVARLPAVLIEIRVVGADAGLFRQTLLRQPPVGERGAE